MSSQKYRFDTDLSEHFSAVVRFSHPLLSRLAYFP